MRPGPARPRPLPPGALLTAALATALGLGCATGGSHPPNQPSPKNRVRSGHAPTPYSAAEIAKACLSGHWRRYLVEVPGQPPLYRVLAFENSTKESTEFISSQVDTRGRPFGEQRRVRARWKAIQAHASFPRGGTTIRAVTVATGAGVFPSWLYEVRRRGGQEVERYWFAKSLPGPPVQYERKLAGKLAFRMTLLGHGVRRPAPARP